MLLFFLMMMSFYPLMVVEIEPNVFTGGCMLSQAANNVHLFLKNHNRNPVLNVNHTVFAMCF